MRVIKSKRMWKRHVKRVEKKINAYKILVSKHERKWPLWAGVGLMKK
jgi:hypothetical protein